MANFALMVIYYDSKDELYPFLEVFGSTAWSPSASKFIYVAERKRKEQNGFEKFILVEHFGEKVFSVTDPVVCVLDLESFSVKVVDLVNFEHSFPSQPVFVNYDTICFTGIEIGSKKLGMTYIYCRNSSIYSAKLEDGSVKAGKGHFRKLVLIVI